MSCRLAVALCAALAGPSLACAPDQVEFNTGGEVISFAAEVVSTPEGRARGLMFREELAEQSGMLFVFDDAKPRTFWMKNTPLSLDIIYISHKGVICSIAKGTTPFSLDMIPSGCAAQTVLEVKAGDAERYGLRRGAAVRHPSVQEPVWACE